MTIEQLERGNELKQEINYLQFAAGRVNAYDLFNERHGCHSGHANVVPFLAELEAESKKEVLAKLNQRIDQLKGELYKL
jgi:hypothetical protein